ncbi:hypothetical protein CsSME_00040033 [Camellia sinensis var. sinensis]
MKGPSIPMKVSKTAKLNCFLNATSLAIFIAGFRTIGAISDVSSDLTIEVGTASFALHNFPLVSRSGRIRKLLLEAKDWKDSTVSRVNLSAVLGGPEAFELAAKFCYGVDTEITLSNVAMLPCAAHFLEMTEDFAEKNLETQTEAYMKDNILPNTSNSISVLHRCESLLPIAEDINLVNRIINAIASNACQEQLTFGLSKLEHNFPSKPETEAPSDWWGKSLTVLNLDFFQCVVYAVKSKGLKQDIVSRILINYAHNSLQGLVAVRDPQLVKGGFLDLELQKKQRAIIEAIIASASTSYRSNLERRIGLQLDQAILEDILILANSHGNNHSPMYDTDSILRIFSIFLNLDEDDDEDNHLRDESEMVYDFDNLGSPKQSSILRALKLLDNYLAEVALDSNLMPSVHARMVNDGLYRAVDIFLKVHPNMKDSERYRLCKTIDCHKLSQEACSQAAQNKRLPVQMAVQVLYFEQTKLRNAMNGGHNQSFFGFVNGQFPQRSGSGAGSGCISPRDNYASVRRENRELKLEVARMRMRLTDLEKDHVSMKQKLIMKSHPANKVFRSFTKKLSKLNALFRIKDMKPIGGKANSETRFLFQKRRTHSVRNLINGNTWEEDVVGSIDRPSEALIEPEHWLSLVLIDRVRHNCTLSI